MTSGRLTQTQFAGCGRLPQYQGPGSQSSLSFPARGRADGAESGTGTPWNQDGINTSISPAIEAQSARGPHQDTALRKEILLHL